MAGTRGGTKDNFKPTSDKQAAHGPTSFFRKRPTLLTIGLIGIYFVLALAAYWPVFPADPSRIVGCPCGDLAQAAWFLAWTPYAIFHSHNPFLTNWVNFPHGANLLQNALMPLLGLLTYPLTRIAGPIASFNLIAWLAFPLSATAMFYVVRHLRLSRLAAFVAGLLYGFSPYMIGQGHGHILLTFVPLLPFILLTSWELFVQQAKHPYRLGGILAIEVIAQFFILPETLAVSVLIVLLGIVLLAVFRSAYITKQRLAYALRGLAIAAGVSIVVLAYPIWVMAAGPQRFTGPNFPPGNPYRSDFIGLVMPTSNEVFSPSVSKYYTTHTSSGDLSEVGDYVGIPLLVIIGIGIIRWRRNRWLIFCATSAFVCWVGSLGPRLLIDSHKTHVILPFAVLTKVPLLQSMLPDRLDVAEWLFISLLVALIIGEWQKAHTANRIHALGWRSYVAKGGLALLVLVTVYTLLPRWPYPSEAVATPALFKNGAYAFNDEVALTYPFTVPYSDQFMLWQATSGMGFKLTGSYVQNPGAQRTESQLPSLLEPASVQEWLAFEQNGPDTNLPWPVVTSITPQAIESYLKRYDIGIVIVDPQTVNSKAVAEVFSSVLGPQKNQGGEYVWNNVQSRLN